MQNVGTARAVNQKLCARPMLNPNKPQHVDTDNSTLQSSCFALCLLENAYVVLGFGTARQSPVLHCGLYLAMFFAYCTQLSKMEGCKNCLGKHEPTCVCCHVVYTLGV